MHEHNCQFDYPVTHNFWALGYFVLLLETGLSSVLIDEHNEVHKAYCSIDPHDSTKAALSTANHQVYRESPLQWSAIHAAWGGELNGTRLPEAAMEWPWHGSLYPRRTEQVHGSQIHHLSATSVSSIRRDTARDRGVCQEPLQVRKCGVLKSCPTRLVESSNCQHNIGTVHVYYT